jgi:hypothetical protein
MKQTSALKKPKRIKPLLEGEFLEQVIDMAHVYGWICAHFRPAKTADGWRTAVSGDGVGFPDLFLLRPATGHAIAAELKVGRRKKTAEQEDWLNAMEECGIPAFTWTPGDWEEIEDALKNGARPAK